MKVSMGVLLDANVWLPLVWDGHAYHVKALNWVSALEEPIYFCRVTQLALLRHLTNKAILADDALVNEDALTLVEGLSRVSSIECLGEPKGVESQLFEYGRTATKSPQLWTDAYLAAFALRSGLTFATFDKGFRKFKGLDLVLL